jgi:flagellar hook-associated protein 3 FlgL
MRISSYLMANRSLDNMEAAYDRVQTAQQQLSTGKTINQPSDDPVGSNRALNLQNTMDKLDQYVSNASSAQSFLCATDNALSQVTDLLRSARTLAVKGASDSTTTAGQATLATQIASILDQLAALGNASDGSRGLFGGQRTTTDAFGKDASGIWQYQGGTSVNGDADIAVTVGPNQRMVINQTGDTVLSGALAALESLKDHLANGQTVAISNDDLAALDDALSTVSGARAQVGSQVQQLENIQSAYATAKTQYTSIMSDTTDADIAQATVELQSAQLTYSGALYATKMSFQTSLLDFLS